MHYIAEDKCRSHKDKHNVSTYKPMGVVNWSFEIKNLAFVTFQVRTPQKQIHRSPPLDQDI